MSEERKMVLQMLADGKISVAEADTLLQALQDCEETPKASQRQTGRRSLTDLVEQVVKKADRALDEAVRTVEEKVAEQSARQPHAKIVVMSKSIDDTVKKVEEGTSDVPR